MPEKGKTTDTEPGEKRIENRTFTQSIRVEGGTLPPSHGLYQPSFNLSEADYLRLKSSSPTLMAAGAAVLSFGISYALPLVVRVFLRDPVAVKPSEWWVAGIAVGLGALLLLGGLLYSRERRSLLRRIDSHFKNNPAELEYRVPGE
jgi:hypothetical protein